MVELSAYTFNQSKLNTITLVLNKRLDHMRDFERQRTLLLKTLLLILYLLQNGLEPFCQWVRRQRPKFEALTYANDDTIRQRARTIVDLVSNIDQLKSYRVDIHRYRSDMNTPGLKRTLIDVDDIATIVAEDPRGVKSFDLPRPNRYMGILLDTLIEEAA